MAERSLPLPAEWRQLRSLCIELPHGPARDALVALLDGVAADVRERRLRATLLAPSGAHRDRLECWIHGLLAEPLPEPLPALLVLSPQPGGRSARVAHAALDGDAGTVGIGRLTVACDCVAVLASPLLAGHLALHTDVLVVAGAESAHPLAQAAVAALQPGCAEVMRWPGEESLAAFWRATFTDEKRDAVVTAAARARLAQGADAARRLLQDEVGEIRARIAEVARARRVEDLGQGGDELKAQADAVKLALADWSAACKEELARAHEEGFLPFDARLLANKLTREDLLFREELWAAITKYPLLNAPVIRPFVSHHYIVVPDPGAVDGIRGRLVAALEAQGTKDLERVNQRIADLEQQLRRNAALYPHFAREVGEATLPRMGAAVLQRPLAAITLEVEAEDKFTRVGVFKRLMEGRMVASMIFSFITMLAGVFVLLGDPSIKRSIMKLSGVVVIMMFGFFGFTLLVKKEEEDQELDEVAERLRTQLSSALAQPLNRASQAILKAIGGGIDAAREGVLARVEAVARARASERARLAEQRKAEDEMLRAFLQRRQAAAQAFAQKAGTLVTALQRAAAPAPAAAAAALAAEKRPLGTAPAKPVTTTVTPGSATPAAPAATAAPPPAPPVRRSASERFGLSAAKPATTAREGS